CSWRPASRKKPWWRAASGRRSRWYQPRERIEARAMGQESRFCPSFGKPLLPLLSLEAAGHAIMPLRMERLPGQGREPPWLLSHPTGALQEPWSALRAFAGTWRGTMDDDVNTYSEFLHSLPPDRVLPCLRQDLVSPDEKQRQAAVAYLRQSIVF